MKNDKLATYMKKVNQSVEAQVKDIHTQRRALDEKRDALFAKQQKAGKMLYKFENEILLPNQERLDEVRAGQNLCMNNMNADIKSDPLYKGVEIAFTRLQGNQFEVYIGCQAIHDRIRQRTMGQEDYEGFLNGTKPIAVVTEDLSEEEKEKIPSNVEGMKLKRESVLVYLDQEKQEFRYDRENATIEGTERTMMYDDDMFKKYSLEAKIKKSDLEHIKESIFSDDRRMDSISKKDVNPDSYKLGDSLVEQYSNKNIKSELYKESLCTKPPGSSGAA